MLLLLFVIPCCLVAAMRPRDSEYLQNGTCVGYSSILPSGACKDFIRHSKVYTQIPKAALRDRRLHTLLEFGIPMLQELAKEGGNIMDICTKTLSLICDLRGLLLQQLCQTLPPLAKNANFIATFGWLACNFIFPPCLDNAGSELSLPCKEVAGVVINTNIFKVTTHHWSQLSNSCPKIFGGPSPYHFLVKTPLKQADIQHIEKCQLYNHLALLNEPNVTISCFHGIGLRYKGTLNVTDNGKLCVKWKSISALQFYPDLDSNYCRNPQGYGVRPWCYTGTESREWSYCPVKRCFQEKPHKESGTRGYSLIAYLSAYLSVVCVVVIVTCVILRRRRNNRKKRFEGELEPYNQITVDSPEHLEKLLCAAEH